MPLPKTFISTWYIYKVTNPNGRLYVGITTDPARRQRDYAKANCKNQIALLRSITKYGYSSHSFEIIEQFESTVDYAFGKELFWIRSYMSNAGKFPDQGGLNMTDGGIGSIGRKMSEETKEKLRQANLGKKYSQETRDKLSAMRRGKKIKSSWTPEKRKAASEQKKASGYRHSEEIKKIIGGASKGNKNMLGKKQSQETIDKRRLKLMGNKFNLGRKQPLEERIKRGLALKGKKKSPEAIANYKAARLNVPGKHIDQYDLNGNKIQSFISVRKAARETNVSRDSIRRILNGVKNSQQPYIFKYSL